MKTRIILLLLSLLASCNLPPESGRVFFYGNDTAVEIGSKGISLGADLVFETDVIVLAGNSRDVVFAYAEQQDLSFAGDGQYAVNNLSVVELPPRTPGSTVILVDQSGSYDSADAMNYRSKLINQFTHDLGGATSFLLGAFSSQGNLNLEPAEYGTTDFTSDSDGVMPYLFELPSRVGGISILFDAMISGIDRLKSVSGSRTLLILAHDLDSASLANESDVITAAILSQVRVDIIYVGNAKGTNPLTKIAQQTGGLFSLCSSDREMITTFNHLNVLYDQPMVTLRMQVKFTPSSGPLGSGVDTYHQLTIHDPIADTDFNPVVIFVKTP